MDPEGRKAHRRCIRRFEIPIYLYRCPDHATTETRCAMDEIPAAVSCPACGSAAARVFTAPRLSFGSPVRRDLIERTERSRDQPDVVSAPPPGSGPGRRADVVRNPALSRLPRP
ncbi:MAG: zinc ribbon domain-containing protein [Nocardioidaceae bacterium]